MADESRAWFEDCQRERCQGKQQNTESLDQSLVALRR